jgi:hypothetical protein
MKYISLSDLREWIFAYMREEITMSRFQELINEKVEERLKEEVWAGKLGSRQNKKSASISKAREE